MVIYEVLLLYRCYLVLECLAVKSRGLHPSVVAEPIVKLLLHATLYLEKNNVFPTQKAPEI